MMKKTPEQLQLKAKILKESIEYFMLSKRIVWNDTNGREHTKYYTYQDLVHLLGATRKTIYNWTTTGKILPVYERKLVEMKILKRGIW